MFGVPLLCFGFSVPSFAVVDSAIPFHIVLDPGHGGVDAGTVHDGLKESDLTLKIAQTLQHQLKKSDRYKVTMTRNEDQTVSLNRRSHLTNQTQPDLFISLHANSSNSTKVSGTDIYIFGQMAGDEESMFLAHQENLADEAEHGAGKEEGSPSLPADVQVILRDMTHTFNTHVSFDVAKSLKLNWEQSLGRTRVHIRQAPFHVLANVRCPSVLIEVGYISNPSEVAWLKKDETITAIARALKKGLDAVIEKMDKNPGSGDSIPHDKS